jgi:hypothetical protein
VVVLRHFRDEILASTEAGRELIRGYYRLSPPLAQLIADHETARFATRMALWPVIGLAALWLHIGTPGMVMLALALVLFAFRRRLGRGFRMMRGVA